MFARFSSGVSHRIVQFLKRHSLRKLPHILSDTRDCAMCDTSLRNHVLLISCVSRHSELHNVCLIAHDACFRSFPVLHITGLCNVCQVAQETCFIHFMSDVSYMIVQCVTRHSGIIYCVTRHSGLCNVCHITQES
jgi:hypothetical protein